MSFSVPSVIGTVVGCVVIIVVGGVLVHIIFKKEKKVTLKGPGLLSLRLVDKEAISHDTYRYVLALPSSNHILGLSIGNHIKLHARINGESVARSYTPVSPANHKGYVEFVIKTYRKGVSPKFPLGGKMSQYLETLTKDCCIEISGPWGNIQYKGNGKFAIKSGSTLAPIEITAKRISLICGGTGLTPMYQLIKAILDSKSDETKISLLFANCNEDDILLRDELEKFRDDYASQFRLWYTLENPPDRWPYSVGYVNQKMVEEQTFLPGTDSVALICGPPPMISGCTDILEKIGYKKNFNFFIY